MPPQITSEEQHLHVAAADAAPGFHSLAWDIAKEFSVPDATPTTVVMNDWNSDWDTMYPFSAVSARRRLGFPFFC